MIEFERKNMGDFKKNPKEPFEVKVPNKIRTRIAMHERAEVSRQREVKSPMEKILSLPSMPIIKKRGSLWSRFTDMIKKFIK